MHTPGPWYTMAKGNDYQSPVSQEGTGKTVALTYTTNDADAHLIAAAPDLLAACEAMLEHRECPTRSPEARLMREAISKAKGYDL